MSVDIITELAQMSGPERTLNIGEYLFHQGEPVTAFYIVLAGRFHLIRHQEDVGAIVLQRAGRGEVLAEASLFSARYHCDAITTTDAKVAPIAKRQLRKRFRSEPDFAEQLAAHLAREIQNARFRSEVLSLRTVASRLDAWRDWHGSLPPKGEWKQLADQIGVSPEALYRELAKQRRSPTSTSRGRRRE